VVHVWVVKIIVIVVAVGFFIAGWQWRSMLNKEGTPSASHNRKSNVIMPHCKTCSGFDKVNLSRCYECEGSKWAPA